MENANCFSIIEILDLTQKYNILPNVQRGFVWKPSQIENIWDSILRGFPIGSFVFNQKTMELLDGQQRASSICVAFREQMKKASSLNITPDNYKIFIDMIKPDLSDKRQYIFRVISKSHPWGYQKKDNTKPLTADNIRKSLEEYNIKNYIKAPIDKFWPYDSELPIPFEYFLESEDWKTCEQKIQTWLSQKESWKNSEKEIINGTENIHSANKLFNRLKKIKNKKIIPALYLDIDKVTEDARLQEYEQDSNKDDDVENLFIRLNSGGTALSGEELNYSILKANIDRGTQKKLEEACRGIMKPSRFITIAYRLFQNSNKKAEQQADALSMRIRPKQFQIAISEKQKAFTDFLQKIFKNKYLTELKHLFSYHPTECKYGLPQPVFNSIADKAPEIMFILLYRIIFKNDNKMIKPNSNLHRRMIGLTLLLLWFGKGDNGRNHSKTLRKIWSEKKHELLAENFWSYRIYELFFKPNTKTKIDTELMVEIPHFTVLENYFRKGRTPLETLSKDNFEDRRYWPFILKTIYNDELLLYIQRQPLHEWFEKFDNIELEDTNRLFDIDHISPQEFIRNRTVDSTLRFWYYTIGNLRAWPYSPNRSDSNTNPAEKLAYNEERLRYLCDSIGYEGKISTSKDIFLKWSICKAEWMKLDSKNLRDRENAEKTTSAVVTRLLEIYRSFYNDLLIESLL